MVTFGDVRGQEQLVVRWNPATRGCKAWPAREKKVAAAQVKKQQRYQAFGVARFEDEEAVAKAWEEKWLESVKAADRGGRG